jgi:hypothetical protein
MKIISVEFREYCTLVDPDLRTTVLLSDTHEFELGPDGWLKWRKKGGAWYMSPASMIRNVGTSEDVPTDSITDETRLVEVRDLKRKGRK